MYQIKRFFALPGSLLPSSLSKEMSKDDSLSVGEIGVGGCWSSCAVVVVVDTSTFGLKNASKASSSPVVESVAPGSGGEETLCERERSHEPPLPTFSYFMIN